MTVKGHYTKPLGYCQARKISSLILSEILRVDLIRFEFMIGGAMTGNSRLKSILRRLGIPEERFVELCRIAGHSVERIEDLPDLGSDPFEVYYSIGDIAGRLGFCERTIRRRLQAGEFGPLGNVLRDDEIRIPWSNVEGYLRRHSLPSVQITVRSVGERVFVDSSISARSPGEKNRKASQ